MNAIAILTEICPEGRDVWRNTLLEYLLPTRNQVVRNRLRCGRRLLALTHGDAGCGVEGCYNCELYKYRCHNRDVTASYRLLCNVVQHNRMKRGVRRSFEFDRVMNELRRYYRIMLRPHAFADTARGALLTSAIGLGNNSS
jgi:hypothetical protein